MDRPNILTQDFFEQMAKKIAQNIAVDRIVLFGSQSNGYVTLESDVDILIIQKENESNNVVRRRIDALFRGRNFPMDIIVCRKEEYEMNILAGHPLFLEISKEGRVLYE